MWISDHGAEFVLSFFDWLGYFQTFTVQRVTPKLSYKNIFEIFVEGNYVFSTSCFKMQSFENVSP